LSIALNFFTSTPPRERISGYSAEELLQKTLSDLVHPDYRAMIVSRLRQRLAGDATPQSYQIAILTKTGVQRWIQISAGTIDYEGAPAGIATAFDITEQIAAEAALRASERQLAAIMDNTGAVIYIKDLEGRFLMVNQQVERIMDIPKGCVTRQDRLRFISARTCRSNDAPMTARWPSRRQPCAAKRESYKQTANTIHISVKVPLHDDHGNVYAICGISTDISEQKRKQRGLIKLDSWMRRLTDMAASEAAFYQTASEAIVDLVDADLGALPCLDEGSGHFTYRGAAGERCRIITGKIPVHRRRWPVRLDDATPRGFARAGFIYGPARLAGVGACLGCHDSARCALAA